MRQDVTRRSLGQLTPVLANCRSGQIEVVDGFKRLRGARALGWPKIRVDVAEVRSAEAKVWMCQSNGGRGLSELEEAWVIRALHREDGLMQCEIARLFGRHKSWEGLSDALQADLRLGLLSATMGRELARLPRGNQDAVAAVIKQRGLTTKQVANLVEAWERSESDEQRAVLLERAGVGDVQRVSRKRARTPAEWLLRDFEETRRRSARLQGRLMGAPLSRLGLETAEVVGRELLSLRPVLKALVSTIERSLGEPAEVRDDA